MRSFAITIVTLIALAVSSAHAMVCETRCSDNGSGTGASANGCHTRCN